MRTEVVVRHAFDENRLFKPRYNIDIGARAFKNCAPRLFNRLSGCVKSSTNVKMFKKSLKTFLFTDCYDLEGRLITEQYAV